MQVWEDDPRVLNLCEQWPVDKFTHTTKKYTNKGKKRTRKQSKVRVSEVNECNLAFPIIPQFLLCMRCISLPKV
jgi:hypothetical protein